MKTQGNINYVKEEKINDKVTVLGWRTDKFYDGVLIIQYTGDGNYKIQAEFLSIESIAEIMKFWIEQKSNKPESK